MTFEDRVNRHRCDLIARIEAEIRPLDRKLQAIQSRGEYYLRMQRCILASSNAMEAWQTFMLTVQLVVPNKITGITVASTKDIFINDKTK